MVVKGSTRAGLGARCALLVLVAFLALPSQRATCEENAQANGQSQQHESLGHRIGLRLQGLGVPDSAVVVLISMLPIVELRGAIPVGYMMKMNPWEVYVLAVAGNMIPIPFILLLLGPVSNLLMRRRLGKQFFEWLFARTRRKSAAIEKYETFGLTAFVAVPLPVTGGWTGAAAAFLMGLRFRHAMLSILLGVMIAGIVMTILSELGWLGAAIAGAALLALAIGGMKTLFGREKGQGRAGQNPDLQC